MRTDKITAKKVRIAQLIIPSAAAALALTGCSGTGGSTSDDDNDTDNVIDGASFTAPVQVAGLPSSPFSSYTVFQPSLADIDGDGDLDLFVGTINTGDNTHKTLFYKNTSSSANLSFILDTTTFTNTPDISESVPHDNVTILFSSAGNIDSDSDIDLVVSTNTDTYSGTSYEASIRFYENSSNTFTVPGGGTTSAFNTLASIALTDLDGDGDLDRILGRSKVLDPDKSDVILEKNNGSGAFTDGTSTLVSETDIAAMTEIPVPSFADLDNDGDQDMFIVMYDDGDITYYENTGSAASPSFVSRTEDFNLAPTGGVKWFPAFGDMDDDGDLDAIIGTSDGKILFAENLDIE